MTLKYSFFLFRGNPFVVLQVNDSEAIVKNAPHLNQPNNQGLMLATVEFEVEVLFAHRKVKVKFRIVFLN